MPRIFIDPGHGGKDRSNKGPTGYIEADGVLDIALRLKPLLQAAAFHVRLSRETDATVSLYDRSAKANNWEADLLVSIHTNAHSNPSANGAETWYSLNGEWGGQFHAEAKRVANIVQAELVARTGLRDRGIKTRLIETAGSPIRGMDWYAVIRRTKCPAIIIEAGFHTNPTEEAWLKSQDYRQKIADAIAAALEKAYPKACQERIAELMKESKELAQNNIKIKTERDKLKMAIKRIQEVVMEFEP